MTGVIYLITNSINGKMYVGQTTKDKPVDRWKQHKRNMNYASYKRIALYRAMRKHGVENFTWEIIVADVPEALLDDLETNCIAAYNGYTKGYNMLEEGNTMRGYKFSPEVLAHLSKVRKGKEPANKGKKFPELSGKNSSRSIPVVCIDTNQRFHSAKEAATTMRLCHSSVIAVCKGRRNKTKGYRFKYADGVYQGVESKSKQKGESPNAKKVVCVETGVVYSSILEASEAINASVSGISSVCRGVRKSIYGKIFKYYKEVDK